MGRYPQSMEKNLLEWVKLNMLRKYTMPPADDALIYSYTGFVLMIFEIHNNEKNDKVIIYILVHYVWLFGYVPNFSFKQKNINFQEIDVDNEYEKRVEMIQKSGVELQYRKFFGDQHIGGCDDLFELNRNNELDNL